VNKNLSVLAPTHKNKLWYYCRTASSHASIPGKSSLRMKGTAHAENCTGPRHYFRDVIAQHGSLSVDANTLDPETDLYNAGLTSLATVGVMLALEDRFNVEFPEAMLRRKTFESSNRSAMPWRTGELTSFFAVTPMITL